MKRNVAFMVILAISAMTVGAETKWKGEEVVQDGALHVMNPEEPLEEVRLELEELWRRGGDEDDLLFGLVVQLVKDETENIYLLDSQLSEIQVLSPSGDHLRTIGREGEGPGEFRNASDMYLGPGGLLGVVQTFPGKVVQLMTDGTPAGNFALPEEPGGGFQLVFIGRSNPDRILLAGAKQKLEGGKQMQVTYLKAYDKDGNEIVHFHEQSQETQFGGMKFKEKTFSDFSRRWALAPDGRVAAALDVDAYRIHIWNPDGSVNRVIERKGYTPVVRAEKDKERFQQLFDGITRWNPGSTFEVSPTHTAVNQIFFRDDGSLWVLSSKGAWEREEGVFASFDVYDRDGRYVRRAHLILDGDPVDDGVFFVGDRLYRVTDLFSAFLANFGGDVTDDADEEPEPVQIIAHRFEPDGGKE